MKTLLTLLFVLAGFQLFSQNDISNLQVVQEVDNTLRFNASFETAEISNTYLSFYCVQEGDTVRNTTSISAAASNHQLQILGLIPETDYVLEIFAFNENGLIQLANQATFSTGAVPEFVSTVDSMAVGNNSNLDGYILTNGGTNGTQNPGAVQVFDRMGNVVWYDFVPGEIAEQRCQQFTFSDEKTLLYTNCHRFTEQRLDGSIVVDVDLSPAYDSLYLHHEIFKNDDGNYVAIYSNTRIIDKTSVGGPEDALVVGQGFIVVSPEGELLQQWSCFDHYDPLTSPGSGGYWSSVFGQESINWLHANAMTQDSDGHYILSFRFANHLIKIHKETGQILWTCGDGGNVEFDFQANTFAGQHNINLNAANNYMLFDNAGKDSLSRVVEFWIDEGYDPNMTMQVWEYILPQELASPILGSAQRLPNGNTLMASGIGQTILEVNTEKEIVWHARQTLRPYRAYYLDGFYDSNEAIDLSSIEEVICLEADPVSLTASPAGGYFSGNGVSNNTFDPTAVGVGEHEITYHFGYEEQMLTLMVSGVGDCSVGINSESERACRVYPNPTDGIVHLQYTVQNPAAVSIDLFDTAGKLVQTISKENALSGVFIQSFDLTKMNLSEGIYLLRIVIGQDSFHEKVILK